LGYKMAVAIGEGWAGLFGTGDEVEGMVEGQPFIEAQMDLNNNTVVLSAARNGSGIPTRGTPGLEDIRDGGLVRHHC
jgi:hypothetical protein